MAPIKDNNFIEDTSNNENLPPDFTDEEIEEIMRQFGITEAKDADEQIGETLEALVDETVKEDIEKSEKAFNESLQQSYIDMDEAFLEYLNNFNIIAQRQEYLKLQLKNKFFYFIMSFMAAVIIFPYVMVFFFRNKIADASIITLSITSLAEIMSAIIVLPKIIAEYLFNKKEDDNKIKIISDMQTYNKEKRHLSGRESDSKKEDLSMHI